MHKKKCSKYSNEEGTGPLRRTYILSPKKAEKNFWYELSCYSIQVPWIQWGILTLEVLAEKSVPVTPEVCNLTWREGIVTLPDLTTQSIRVGECIQ